MPLNNAVGCCCDGGGGGGRGRGGREEVIKYIFFPSLIEGGKEASDDGHRERGEKGREG